MIGLINIYMNAVSANNAAKLVYFLGPQLVSKGNPCTVVTVEDDIISRATDLASFAAVVIARRRSQCLRR